MLCSRVRAPDLDLIFFNGLCQQKFADRCPIHVETCTACSGQRAVSCISFLMFCLDVLTWCLVMLVCSLHRLDGRLIPGRDRFTNPLEKSLCKGRCGTRRNSFQVPGAYHTIFSCSLGGRMPFEEGAVRLRASIPRFAPTTKQFQLIWRFTFGPLRVCPAALFIGIDIDTLKLLLRVRWRRLGHLSVVSVCMLSQCMPTVSAACFYTGPGCNVRSDPAPHPVL